LFCTGIPSSSYPNRIASQGRDLFPLIIASIGPRAKHHFEKPVSATGELTAACRQDRRTPGKAAMTPMRGGSIVMKMGSF
jgi:hypothetical protein